MPPTCAPLWKPRLPPARHLVAPGSVGIFGTVGILGIGGILGPGGILGTLRSLVPSRPAWAGSRSARTGILLLGLLVAAAGSAPAEGRTLTWPEIRVEATLDAEGRLHVVERQTIIFDGEWNGGERVFDVRSGQDLEFVGMRRLDAADTSLADPGVAMPEGDLDGVGNWRFTDRNTLRWRARAESDPPFSNERRAYRLEYVLSGALQPTATEGVYRLAHEFAFADRLGAIDTLSVELRLDPVWRPLASAAVGVEGPAGRTIRQTWTDLRPGASPITELSLEYLGEGRPDAVVMPLPRPLQALPFVLGLVAMLWLTVDFLRRERGSPRGVPLPDLAGPPSREWISEHVLSRPAEEIGALWDRKVVGPPEVTALLARMVGEGKLRSWTEPAKSKRARPVLHLELMARRLSLKLAEEALVDGLFFAGTTTDTERVKEHYRGKGFDPAANIRLFIEKRLPKNPPPRDAHPKGRRWWTPKLTLAVLGLVALTLLVEAELVFLVVTALFVTAAPFLFSLVVANVWKRRLHWPRPVAAVFIVPLFGALAFLTFGALFLAVNGMPNPGLVLLAALLAAALVPVIGLSSVLFRARGGESAETVFLRRRLYHAREFFRAELKKQQPDVEDAWVPYLLAFGLSPQIAGWEESWGVAVAGKGRRDASWSDDHVDSSVGGSSGSGRSWTGGGGAFGGAGATSGWATAASSLASGVPAPSSSGGSSGGGGGGSSSGGGGGGGW